MSTIRHFDGARDTPKGGIAAQMMRLQIQKGGKLLLTSRERYRMMLEQKLETSRMARAANNPFLREGSDPAARPHSKMAEQMIKMVNQRKAAKREKALRDMVAIIPRMYGNGGRIDAKGRVWDPNGQMVLRVTRKKGHVLTAGGMRVGYRYNPKRRTNDYQMQQLIEKYQFKRPLPNQPNIYGHVQPPPVVDPYGYHALGYTQQNLMYGVQPGEHMQTNVFGHNDSVEIPRNANIQVTAFGVSSGNVHGTYADNVWGGTAENVWGNTYTDIWGGFGTGGGGLWKNTGHRIWGTGAPGQKNWFAKPFRIAMAMLGFSFGRKRKGGARGNAPVARGRR